MPGQRSEGGAAGGLAVLSRAAWASVSRHYVTGVRGASLDWDRRWRVTPVSLFSWRVIVSENRFPLFRITRLATSRKPGLKLSLSVCPVSY